jgi:RNA polymerase sigma-70 factor, ECF subfamily
MVYTGGAVDYDRVFHRVYPQLFRYLYRITGDADAADDVAQEAFVRLTEQELAEADVRPWLFAVAMNLVRDRARKEARHRRLDVHVPQPSTPESPDRAAERVEAVTRVRRVLNALPERDRMMLLMREEGFHYNEIARAIDVAPGSVGTLLARAGRRFAEAFGAMADHRETVNESSG